MAIWRVPVRLTFQTGAGSGVNTFAFRTESALGEDAGISGAVEALSQFYLSVATIWGSGNRAIFDGAVTEIGTTTPRAGKSATPFNRQGTNGTAPNGPAGVGAVVTWRSTLATRRGRGRTFLVPMPSTSYETDGTLSPSTLTTLQGAATTLVNSSLSDNGWALGVWSEADGVLRDFVTATVRDRVAFLSSRRD